MESLSFCCIAVCLRYAGELLERTEDCTVYASQQEVFAFLNYFHIISIQLFDSVNHSVKELYLKTVC